MITITEYHIWSIVCFWRNSPPPQWAMASPFTSFIDHTQRRTTVGRTPLDEWSARRSNLYLTTHTTLTTNFHALGGIRTHNLSRRAAADLRVRPRGHWDRLRNKYTHYFIWLTTLTAVRVTNDICHRISNMIHYLFMARPTPVGRHRLNIESSRSHSDAPRSVGLLWTGDQPDAETSTWQNTTLTIHRHPHTRRDSNPQPQHSRPTP